VVVLTLLALGLTGCGRSAPEGADGGAGEVAEPVAAGIRVASEQTVVAPSSTTAPPATAATPTTTTSMPTGPSGTYVVQAGDTLSVIASQFGITVDAISQANGITDVNSIRPGQELVIPPG
jgi:LysM repeat protein